MFAVELVASVFSGSTALAADAADFLGGLGELCPQPGRHRRWRRWAVPRCAAERAPRCPRFTGLRCWPTPDWRALARRAARGAHDGRRRTALALAVNFGVAALLYRFPRRRRQHEIGVALHAQRRHREHPGADRRCRACFGTGTVWPDVGVAAIPSPFSACRQGRALVGPPGARGAARLMQHRRAEQRTQSPRCRAVQLRDRNPADACARRAVPPAHCDQRCRASCRPPRGSNVVSQPTRRAVAAICVLSLISARKNAAVAAGNTAGPRLAMLTSAPRRCRCQACHPAIVENGRRGEGPVACSLRRRVP